jgi:Methylase involved in ubiquinone/menaquinone biosynthesis
MALLVQLQRRFVRWAFERFYNEYAWSYDSVAWLVSRGLWQAWTQAALPFLEGQVLELGCGTGYVQLARAQQKLPIVGLDASPFMLGHSRKRLARAGYAAYLVQARSQKIPFADQSFDSVLSTFPSDYILHPDTLREIVRVLRPNGRFVLVDAAHFTQHDLYAQLVDIAYWLTFQRSLHSRSSEHSADLPDLSHDPRLAVLHQAGLACTINWVTVAQSRVMVLVAQPEERSTIGYDTIA